MIEGSLDNMDRWKSRGGKSQRRERVRRKKMQVREKGLGAATAATFSTHYTR